ncbi:serine hydrolase domain-containing protein [Kaistella palustris]|uniref:serine hydrolase domain-containing protein n=1 Tax=Kaistella palustris TaxID=493376 RepID=UPI000413B4AD|nr:serine hydrolase domain-containing protein [Kaistella palustris]
MKFLPHFIILLFSGFMLFSCSKETQNDTDSETSLPNYGNIDLDGIFKRKDNRLANKDSIVRVIDNYYRNVWENGDLWGGFLIAKGDDILYEKYRGFAQDNKQVPISDTVALHVASISKTLTAMAVMKLIEEKKLNMDDHVTSFFPEFPYPKVTVFTLLSQRSGLPKYEYVIDKIKPRPAELDKKFLTNHDILNLLIKYKPELARNTDTGFMYCNTNYALLALIIEKVTKTPFPEAMQQMVFRPLKMTHTYIFEEKDTLTAAKSFFQRGPKVYPYDRLDLIYGDKNVYTTPRDLLNFSKALFAKNFLRQDLQDMIFEPYSNERPGVNNYGIGFRMKIFSPDDKLTYHNGWWHGTNSVFAHLLKSNVTIIAIGNKYSSRVYSALALSGLFENFPYETQKFQKEMRTIDSLKKTGGKKADAGTQDAYSE